MTTATVTRPLGALTDEQLAAGYCAALERGEDGSSYLAELDRRDQAARRRDRGRAAARARNAEWEAAAYAQYLEASAYCAGDVNMLSEAGRRAKRDAWPMLWQGSDETARGLASDSLITFWDYVAPDGRVPGPGQYAAAERAAAAEHAARSEPPAESAPEPKPAPRMARVPSYRRPTVPVPDYSPRPAATVTPGPMARYITALGAVTRATDAARRSLESYPKSSVRGTK